MRPDLEIPGFVEDGQEVVVPLGDGTTTGIRGTVTAAAGYHGRVKTRKFERWFHINDMRVFRETVSAR